MAIPSGINKSTEVQHGYRFSEEMPSESLPGKTSKGRYVYKVQNSNVTHGLKRKNTASNSLTRKKRRITETKPRVIKPNPALLLSSSENISKVTQPSDPVTSSREPHNNKKLSTKEQSKRSAEEQLKRYASRSEISLIKLYSATNQKGLLLNKINKTKSKLHADILTNFILLHTKNTSLKQKISNAHDNKLLAINLNISLEDSRKIQIDLNRGKLQNIKQVISDTKNSKQLSELIKMISKKKPSLLKQLNNDGITSTKKLSFNLNISLSAAKELTENIKENNQQAVEVTLASLKDINQVASFTNTLSQLNPSLAAEEKPAIRAAFIEAATNTQLNSMMNLAPTDNPQKKIAYLSITLAQAEMSENTTQSIKNILDSNREFCESNLGTHRQQQYDENNKADHAESNKEYKTLLKNIKEKLSGKLRSELQKNINNFSIAQSIKLTDLLEEPATAWIGKLIDENELTTGITRSKKGKMQNEMSNIDKKIRKQDANLTSEDINTKREKLIEEAKNNTEFFGKDCQNKVLDICSAAISELVLKHTGDHITKL